jgi:hypothetical protein
VKSKSRDRHWFDFIVQLELYSSWTLGRANLAIQALQFFLLLSIKTEPLLALGIVVAGSVLAVAVGWWGVERQKLLARQNSIVNRHNSELMTLLERSNKRKKKEKDK